MAREPYANFWPKVADTAFVAESADLIGDVTIGEHASVWYHTTLRADINKIVIGEAGRANLHLAKNRNGPTGDVPLHFEAELMRFSTREADEHDQESE